MAQSIENACCTMHRGRPVGVLCFVPETDGIFTGLKLENYYFFTFTFSRPEVRKLLLFYVFTFSRPEVRKLLLFYVFTFSRPEVRKLFRIYVFTFSRPEVGILFRIYVFTFSRPARLQ